MAFPKQLLLSYVEGLELLPFDKVNLGGLKAVDDETAYVVGSLAVGFPEGLDPKLVADIQNSMLFAQFAANAKHNKTDQAYEWYQAYKTVLENIGWVVHNFDWEEVQNAGGFISVDKLLLELAAAYMGATELKVLGSMVDALARAANDDAVKLYDNSSISRNKANFQVAIGGASGGNAVLKAGAYIYSIQSNITRVLFVKFGSQAVKFEYNSQTVILNDEVYGNVRQTIIEKLGNYAKTYVASIDLKP